MFCLIASYVTARGAEADMSDYPIMILDPRPCVLLLTLCQLVFRSEGMEQSLFRTCETPKQNNYELLDVIVYMFEKECEEVGCINSHPFSQSHTSIFDHLPYFFNIFSDIYLFMLIRLSYKFIIGIFSLLHSISSLSIVIYTSISYTYTYLSHNTYTTIYYTICNIHLNIQFFF